jgi:hypothetical protein
LCGRVSDGGAYIYIKKIIIIIKIKASTDFGNYICKDIITNICRRYIHF